MNRKLLYVALPIAVAVPVAAFTGLGQQPARQTAGSGKTQTLRLNNVTQQALANAIDRGAAYIRANPGAGYTIQLPEGRFDLAANGTSRVASINVSNIDACPGGLTINGAGMDRTTLIRDDDILGIVGRGTRCVTFSNLGFTQHQMEVSQGTVVSVDPSQVTLDIPRGFPTPDQLMPTKPWTRRDGQERIRRYLREYRMTPSGPQIVENQPQIRWQSAERVAGSANRWRFQLLAGGARRPDFRPGDLIAVKSKSGDQAYRFLGADRITFDHVRWSLDSRGVFRNTNNVTVQNCVVSRPAPINGVPVLLATSDGGPQIGQPHDYTQTSGHLVQNNSFTGMGDDGIMMAHATGIIRNNRITDSFARGIIMVDAANTKLENNVLTRAPLLAGPGGRIAARKRARQAARDRGAANDNDF